MIDKTHGKVLSQDDLDRSDDIVDNVMSEYEYVIAVPCLSFIFGCWDYPPRNQNTVILWAANYTSIYGIFEEVTDKYDGEDHDGDSHGDFGCYQCDEMCI